jgi:dihydropteroate synthase
MVIGGIEFDTENRCYIMGILNVTPDSFSDGGKWKTIDSAMRHAEEMAAAGADIIDIGGESTRPGHEEIPVEEELDRVIPIIEALERRLDVPSSIDTYKSAVAREAVRAGADLVNDIWGLKRDADMAGVIKESGVSCCLMHNRDNMNYTVFMPDMLKDLSASVSIAGEAGIAADKIILDPGLGFAKTYEMNLEAVNKLHMVKELGYPVLLGASRKSFVGLALQLPVTERVEGTIATTVIGVMRGCSFVRVHDVKETRRAVTMTEAILCRV